MHQRGNVALLMWERASKKFGHTDVANTQLIVGTCQLLQNWLPHGTAARNVDQHIGVQQIIHAYGRRFLWYERSASRRILFT